MIPLLVLGTFSYAQMRTLLIEREKTALEESLKQEVYNLNYKVDSYLNAINLIIWDESVRTNLIKTFTNNYDMYYAYMNEFDPLFTTVRSLHSEIKTITIYTDNPIYPHGSTLRPLTDIETQPWYQTSLSKTAPLFYVSPEKKSLLLIYRLYLSGSGYTNVLYMQLDYTKTFDTLSKLYDENYGVFLEDENGSIIYSFHNFKAEKTDYALPHSQFVKLKAGNLTDAYVFKVKELKNFNWKVYLYRPIITVSEAAGEITTIVLLIILSCIILLLLLSIILSKQLVHPLEELADNMDEIEDGEMTVRVQYDSTDELGHLLKSFKHMVARIQNLIEEVYKSKIAQQEFEMKALQAQINPHFLYNSLSLINGKAIMSEQEDISRMAQLLSTFYRTTLNKGKNTISVQDELANTKSYIDIQKMMHANSFDVSYDIEETALTCQMINLLLQPLVENGICHGIDHKETTGRGHLFISCKVIQNLIIFTITDNGCGMTAEKLDMLLTAETDGYGVYNVHQRIQLYYGTEYGLEYESSLHKGTRVILTIPKRN